MARAGSQDHVETTALHKLVAWFIKDALPEWRKNAFDARCGQFVECLALNADPTSDPVVRVRSAARQIYVFADAARLGLVSKEYLSIAEVAFRNLDATAWITPEGGYARTIDRLTPSVIDATCDLYDNACMLLSMAALLHATGNSIYRERVERLLSAIDRRLTSPVGGWAEDDRGTLPRRHNPHMHFFEACLALVPATGDRGSRDRLEALYTLFKSRFYFADDTILREFFGPCWEIGDEFGSDRLDPGHMCEWSWLLGAYARLTGTNTRGVERELLDIAIKIGRGRDGLLVDEVSPTGDLLKGSSRLWLQAEYIKALLTVFEATGVREYLIMAEAVSSRLLDVHLSSTPRGTWRDNFNQQGDFLASTIPSSSLYHLWTSVLEVMRVLPSACK